MTKYDDARLNTANPLELRSSTVNGSPYEPGYGRPKFQHSQHDQNLLNLVRDAGPWTPARAYTKNESVWYDGIQYLALQDNAAGANPWEDDGTGWVVYAPRTGYGEMTMAAATAGANITSAWQTIDVFDTIPYTPVGMTFDLPSSTFDLDYRGLWDMSLVLFVNFDDSNQGRTVQVRLWSVTENAVDGTPITIAVGRNTGGINVSVPFPIDVGTADVGDSWRLEIGNASATITGVQYEYVGFSGRQVAALRPNVAGGTF